MDNSNIKTQQNQTAYQKAKKEMLELKSFYSSLLTYVIVNMGFIYIWYEYSNPGFQWFWFPLIGWGFGLAMKALYVYDVNIIFGKQWEQRKIERYLSKENHFEASETEKNNSYLKARKKINSLKGFYRHFAVYVLVNVFIVAVIVRSSNVDIFSFDALSTPLFWGIGLVAHAFGVFGDDFFLGKSWEERKIKKLMDAEM
jgi:hypothetical protein